MNQGAMYIAGRPGGRGRGGGRRSGRARAAFPGGARVSAVYMDHTYHTSNAKANNRAKQQALPPPGAATATAAAAAAAAACRRPVPTSGTAPGDAPGPNGAGGLPVSVSLKGLVLWPLLTVHGRALHLLLSGLVGEQE